MLYDAHLHISLFPDPVKLCKVARSFNIMPVSCSVSLDDSLNNASLAAALGFPVFVGIHPCFGEASDSDLRLLQDLALTQAISGIGECGLDAYSKVNLQIQEKLLKSQLEFAAANNLPVSLHVRKCHGELIRTLKPLRGKIFGIVHNFTFSEELAREYLSLGLALSIGRHLLKPSKKLLSAILLAGPERVLLETDADFSNCQDYDPSPLIACHESLAKFFSLSFDSMEQCLEHNACKFLGLSNDLRLRC